MLKFARSMSVFLSLLALPIVMGTATTPLQAEDDPGIIYKEFNHPGIKISMRMSPSGSITIVYLSDPSHSYAYYPATMTARGFMTFYGVENASEKVRITDDFKYIIFGNTKNSQKVLYERVSR